MLLCHGEDFKSSSKYNTCSIFFWIDAWMGTVAASGNNHLPCPLYWVCLSYTCCVSYVIYGIIQYYCYILLFYCYIVLCIYITHCTYIFNHCNELALNGSLIGNKHICICIVLFPTWLKNGHRIIKINESLTPLQICNHTSNDLDCSFNFCHTLHCMF
jgi:hypothetical protein